jgi:hypothetical protein
MSSADGSKSGGDIDSVYNRIVVSRGRLERVGNGGVREGLVEVATETIVLVIGFAETVRVLRVVESKSSVAKSRSELRC